MKNIFQSIILSLLIIGTLNLPKELNAKEITNIQWNKSVAKGKKLFKFRETVTSPALGKEAWKITLLPRDCGRDNEGDYSDCKNNGRDAVVGHGGGDRARSEYSSDKRYTGEKWISVSIYLPNDFKSVEPVSTSLFQIYEWGKKDEQRHPRMMLRVKNGVLEPRYYPVNGSDVSGNIIKHLFIDDMKDKWTTIVFHTKMGKAPGEGFSKMYVNDVLYNEYNGRTGYGGQFFNKFGIYHSWITRWNDAVNGEYPTQVVYYDTLFRTNSKEKLLKLLKTNGLNLDLLSIEQDKQASYSCGDIVNSTWYCAIAARKSDLTVQFFVEDPNERTARIKATSECFKEHNDCTIIFSGKNN